MGEKGSGEERAEKGPLPTQYGGMHTTFPPLIINSTKKVKGVWRVNAPIFILYPPKKGEKKATENDTKGKC